MPRIVAVDLLAVDLPFRLRFRHAASSRVCSESLFLNIHLDDGASGWGEALPRSYVTGETRDGACGLLAERILPRLLGWQAADCAELGAFLTTCDGRAPAGWVAPAVCQSAAWCAVDLALLDAYGRSLGCGPLAASGGLAAVRYSGVVSAGRGFARVLPLVFFRAFGCREIKVKVDGSTTAEDIARIRSWAGPRARLRVDANMAWNVESALRLMPGFAQSGVRSFEQPLPARDLLGAARLRRETGLDIVADEALTTRESLENLLEAGACTAINARISKCGGLIATLARCREAQTAGLWVQVGCQVGESSLLAAAQMKLLDALPGIRHAEGAFANLLLKHDPARPLLRLRHGGRPPAAPPGDGLGVAIDRRALDPYVRRNWSWRL